VEAGCISHADGYSSFYGKVLTGSEYFSVTGFLGCGDEISGSIEQDIS
jgi:hypothetical protein